MLIAVELVTLFFAINTLSAVRTYVGAEGLWSKAQKDAVYYLDKYGTSHNEQDYNTYLDFLKVNLGDHKTRMELLKPNPDYAIARQGFLEGRLHPDDIDGAIKLVRRFHSVSYIARAIQVWAKGDTLIGQLQAIGNDLHAEITAANPSAAKIDAIRKQVAPLNIQLTILEDEFSYTLGAGSRWLTGIILTLLFCLVLTVEVSGLSLTISVSRGITRGLNEIIHIAKKISTGDFSGRAKVFSRDEIGVLANSFNTMANQLEHNIDVLKESEDELQKSKEMAEQAVIIKDHFLANMSHEIRTPMNAIIGFTHLLEHTTLTEDQQQYIEAIRISGNNLTVIINDILDYSKIKSGIVVLQETDISIRRILDSIYILLRSKAEEKNIDFSCTVSTRIPDSVIGDAIRLTQILSNLIDNALKFTEQGAVQASAMLQSETADTVTILFRIQDTGTGIAIEKQDIIFERFTQVSEETSRKYGGTGLGLSIVKSLVELHHGTIALHSEMGVGSIFTCTITFPKEKANAGQPNNTNATQGQSEKRRLQILYAEDNGLNQKLVLHFSKNFGFDTDIAANGKIALEKLQAKKYDLVLMDIQMPEMDGYEATRHIRNTLKSNIPIIAITAHAMSGEKEKCLSIGMNDFISKPFNPKELNEKINAFFEE